MFILSSFVFDLSLAKRWSGNPKLEARKHKLTFSEPVVHSSCFKEILAFQTWRILPYLHQGLSLLPAPAVSFMCGSDSSWLMSNCISNGSNCTSINTCVAAGCTGLALKTWKAVAGWFATTTAPWTHQWLSFHFSNLVCLERGVNDVLIYGVRQVLNDSLLVDLKSWDGLGVLETRSLFCSWGF